MFAVFQIYMSWVEIVKNSNIFELFETCFRKKRYNNNWSQLKRSLITILLAECFRFSKPAIKYSISGSIF